MKCLGWWKLLCCPVMCSSLPQFPASYLKTTFLPVTCPVDIFCLKPSQSLLQLKITFLWWFSLVLPCCFEAVQMCRCIKYYLKITVNEERCYFAANSVPVKDLQEDVLMFWGISVRITGIYRCTGSIPSCVQTGWRGVCHAPGLVKIWGRNKSVTVTKLLCFPTFSVITWGRKKRLNVIILFFTLKGKGTWFGIGSDWIYASV